MHHPELHLMPKTMCQDNVENYFTNNFTVFWVISFSGNWTSSFSWNDGYTRNLWFYWYDSPPLIWCLFPWLNQNKQLLTIWTILSDEKNQSWLGFHQMSLIELNGKRKRVLEIVVLVSQPGEHMVNKNESRKNETKSTLISQSYS